MRKLVSVAVMGLSAVGAQSASASCGAAMCMLNTNWSVQDVWTQPGARLDLRYEYIDQNELRSGTGSPSADDIADMHHRELNTLNQNLQANFDYAFSETYGLSISTPLISREHNHLHVSHSDPTDIEHEQWDFTRLGDIRVVGRMQLSATTDLHQAYGINLGVKLPTGDYQVANADGEQAERSLQPGTGTTDAIVGAYFRQSLPSMKSQWFGQVLWQEALNERDEFKPGKQFSVDLGYRYSASQSLSYLLQINGAVKSRDAGAQAEPDESGAKNISLSPGVSFALNRSSQIYGFIHHRLYSDVNGIQLSSKNSVVVGLSTHF
jgi:hypothetical protein